MIDIIRSFDECQDFISDFRRDPDFSDSMLSNEEQMQNNLTQAIEQPEKHTVWGVYQENRMTGLFSFLILPDEQYMEMLVGLSCDKAAYQEMFAYLKQNFSNFKADFVFNPINNLLRDQLEATDAEFEQEQYKMVLKIPVMPEDTAGAVLYTPQYEEQYCAIHNQDVYWTGEKIVTAPDRFQTFLAINGSEVVGYLDVTKGYEENEIFDLFVSEGNRRMGYGRKLLAAAIKMNQPNGLMLTVNVDNLPAICLYESMGFLKEESENSVTAHWIIRESRKC